MAGEGSQTTEARVGLLASPGAVTELARNVLPGLEDRIHERLPGVRRRVEAAYTYHPDPQLTGEQNYQV
ncbi:hypothetical protein FHR32_007510 [Streptosporangium album]|uniref:Uncharacterized protein n=1 Tax=Streptosporangium album TaxID=47479 RepID=A0A7W7WE61_9ACTN|nr:hypothetical protein [Streptosporangium album]MBB4943110.1 hypothetical protein [Streptosporangium album]